MSLINSTAIPSGATAYELEQSLRFNDDDSANLKRLFTATGNRKTWTFSCWAKRGKLGAEIRLFGCYQANDSPLSLKFDGNDKLTVDNWAGAMVETTARFRDNSAWYHIILALDTTQSTASNRAKIYVNGVQQSTVAGGAGYPGLNLESVVNLTGQDHRIGTLEPYDGSQYYDGYLAEVNFIDGATKVPADFGETGTYGEWKPVEYSGSYGTTGFYLPFKQDYTVEGFSTVTFTGNGASTQYVGGVGFQSDLTWLKKRSATQNHNLFDSIRGVTKGIKSNSDAAEETDSTFFAAFNTDGFSLGSGGFGTSDEVVAWNWDMGGSNATNTEGSIQSTVRANPTYGQSIVTYTGNGVGYGSGGATVGHGLSSAPEFILVKRRDSSSGWVSYHPNQDGGTNGERGYMHLNAAQAYADYHEIWADTKPTASVFKMGSAGNINANNGTYVAYCFHSVTGYSKFSSYTGNGNATGTSVTTGFKPAFVMIKKTAVANWHMYDNTRSPTNPINKVLQADSTRSEGDNGTGTPIDFNANGFQLKSSSGDTNANGADYIYMAFADKREYAYWLDQSGNNNDWTSNNLTESDVMVDSPTNNFATMNPLDRDGDVVVSEGNLKALQSGVQQDAIRSSFGMSTGKWYYEAFVPTAETYIFLGLANTEWSVYGNVYDSSLNWVFQSNGGTHNGSEINTNISALSGGDIVQVAYDLDAGKIWWGVNNTWVLSGNPSTAANPVYSNLSGTLAPVGSFYQAENGSTFNFGQDSSFAGIKTAQGNQDSGGVGDFYYTPPSGFKALCTKNLPDVAVVPSEYFNSSIWTADGSSRTYALGSFAPDLVWYKSRSDAESHRLLDTVRGDGSTYWETLYSNTTGAETEDNNVTNISASGITVVAAGNSPSISNRTYVAWNWKANGSGSSNTDGSITSTVSANVDAGFSIVSYTGTGSATTVGHGLNKTPEAIITKSRNATQYWIVQHDGLSSVGHNMYLQTTNYQQADNQYTGKSATTLTVSGGSVNANNTTYISYCFHSVEGYSKMGVYTGNANADGTFIYTGFRPSLIIVKPVNNASSWTIMDTKVNTFNVGNKYFKANTSDGENQRDNWDFLSNGFKIRNSDADINPTNAVIYLAFAETPFKYSNAR